MQKAAAIDGRILELQAEIRTPGSGVG